MTRPLQQALRTQRGVTMLMVLLMLSVMLLGGLALARVTEIGTLAAGNGGYREASLQASEVGINTAFDKVKKLADEGAIAGSWYWPTMQTATGGIPDVAWASTPSVTVGSYTVRYAVERMCTVAAVTSPERECLLKQDPNPDGSSRCCGQEALAAPNARQFRITVRVTGPKDTETWVQSLVTRG